MLLFYVFCATKSAKTMLFFFSPLTLFPPPPFPPPFSFPFLCLSILHFENLVEFVKAENFNQKKKRVF